MQHRPENMHFANQVTKVAGDSEDEEEQAVQGQLNNVYGRLGQLQDDDEHFVTAKVQENSYQRGMAQLEATVEELVLEVTFASSESRTSTL
jgi:hypothetical protein